MRNRNVHWNEFIQMEPFVYLQCGDRSAKNLNASIETYKRLGLVPGRAIEVPELAADGREIAAGSGLLLLLAPKAAQNSGPVDDFLASRGEGLMGVTIEVADIARVRDYLKAHAVGVLDPRWESADYVLIPVVPQLMASGYD